MDWKRYSEIYWKHHNAPKEDHEKILAEMLLLLEEMQVAMPMPKYKFLVNDITTWKYIEGKCSLRGRGYNGNYRWAFNPSFKYKDLSPQR